MKKADPIAPSKLAEMGQDLLSKALKSFRLKKFDEAQGFLDQAASLGIETAHYHFLIGVLFSKLNNTEKALHHIRKAIKSRPAMADYHYKLSLVLLKQENNIEALNSLQTALFIDPRKTRGFLRLALVNFSVGKFKRGARAMATVLNRMVAWPFRAAINFPVYFSVWGFGLARGLFSGKISPGAAIACEKANYFVRRNRQERAIKILNKALKKNPQEPELTLILARQLSLNDNNEGARKIVAEALDADPKNPRLLAYMAELLCFIGRGAEAIPVIGKIPKKYAEEGFVLKTSGVVYFRNNNAEKALSFLEAALPKVKKKSEILNYTGRALASLGKLDAAEEAFRKSIAEDKTYPNSFIALAKMNRVKPGDPLFDRVLLRLNDRDLFQKRRSNLHFAAGFVFEKAKDYDKAFSHFKAANSLRDVSFPFESWVSKQANFEKVFTPSFLKKLKIYGNPSKKPIFIVGMPRSGTTLTAQILSAHSAVFGAGERETINNMINDFQESRDYDPEWPLSATHLTQKKIKEMAGEYLAPYPEIAPGARHVTDKMPGNFWELGLITSLFPNAKIIHCTRDPLDTCLSIFFQPFSNYHTYAFGLETVGFYYKLYQKQMKHWHKVLPGRILDFPYEKTVSDPENQIRTLLKFCGLEWEANCLNFQEADSAAQTASFAQVRQPLYKTSSQKWKLYENHLDALKEALK